MTPRLTEVFVIREDVDFSDNEKEQLYYLIHDKNHLGQHGTVISGLEKALRTTSTVSAKPLYRGLPRTEEIAPGTVLPGT